MSDIVVCSLFLKISFSYERLYLLCFKNEKQYRFWCIILQIFSIKKGGFLAKDG